MDFEGFDPKKIDEYSQQAKTLYGKTDAYKEFEQKSKNRTAEQEKDLNAQVMELFAKLGEMRPCEPDSEAAQNWAKELQAFFTEHFYTCTPQILKSLAGYFKRDYGNPQCNCEWDRNVYVEVQCSHEKKVAWNKNRVGITLI